MELICSNLKIEKKGEYTAQAVFEVKNTGDRAGSEVAQLYIHDPRPKVKKPEVELVGFAKVALQPGETKTVTIPIGVSRQIFPEDLAHIQHKAFSYYDVSRKSWIADRGEYEFRLGPSSTVVEVARSFVLEKSFKWIGQQQPGPLQS